MRAHAHTHIHKHTKKTHTPANLFWLLADTQVCSSAWMEADGGGWRRMEKGGGLKERGYERKSE